MNHRSANRGIPPSLLRAESSASAKNKTASKYTPARTFVEDFNMEHSSANVVSKLTMEAGIARTSNAYIVNLPSCVFLG